MKPTLRDTQSLRRNHGKVDERRINQHILPVWGTQKASKIRFADVATLHAKIGKSHPYEAEQGGISPFQDVQRS